MQQSPFANHHYLTNMDLILSSVNTTPPFSLLAFLLALICIRKHVVLQGLPMKVHKNSP